MDDYNLNTIQTAILFYGDVQKIDKRTYDESIILLKALGFNKKHKFSLLTNNPLKIQAFKDSGLQLLNNKSILASSHKRVMCHLNAKEKLCGHDFHTI